MSDGPCYVYLAGAANDWIKIGISSNSDNRCVYLSNCSNRGHVYLIKTWRFSSRSHAYTVEQGAHSLLNRGLAGCEWFQTTAFAGMSAVRKSRAIFNSGGLLWVPLNLRQRQANGLPAAPETVQRAMGLPFLPPPIAECNVIDLKTIKNDLHHWIFEPQMAPATLKKALGSRRAAQADYEREQAREAGRAAGRAKRKEQAK